MRNLTQKVILLVEDKMITTIVNTQALEKYNYQVILVATDEEAIKTVENTYGIDLILMDIYLGNGIDGTQAAERILSSHDLPILFLSSRTEPELIKKIEKITSYVYVVKNSSITILDTFIKMALKLFDAKVNEKKQDVLIFTSDSKYKVLVEGIPRIMYSFSTKRGCIYYSSHTISILGYTPEKLYSQLFLWQDSIHPDDVGCIDDTIKENTLGKPFKKEYRIRDGKDEWHLEGIIEGTNVGTWEWNIQKGEMIFNEKWAEIIGDTLEEIFLISFRTWLKFAYPNDLKKSDILIQQHFAGIEPYYHCESRMKHKNGSWVWILDRGKVIEWTQDGKPLRMYGTHMDITEQKKTHSTLQESELIFNQFMIHSHSLIYIKDDKLRLLKVSKTMEDLLGKKSTELIGKDSYDLVPPEFAKQAIVDDLKVLNEHTKFIAGITTDITVIKLAEIQKLLKEKYFILKAFYHRIKKNMASVYGLLKLQEETLTDNAPLLLWKMQKIDGMP